MRLIVHAPNVHQGGGQKLLTSLILAIKQPAILILDSRYQLPANINSQIEIYRTLPNIKSRVKAEFRLRKLSNVDDTVICFGNLPPLLKNLGKVFIYLQNRYLCSNANLKGFSIKVQLRILLERMWLKSFLRDSRIIVQGETMKRNVDSFLSHDSLVMPFFPSDVIVKTDHSKSVQYDYLYVASGEPHKNHLKLLDAWIMLIEYGFNPSLRLTLDLNDNSDLSNEILYRVKRYNLNVISGVMATDSVQTLYTQSGALIYPSLFESFGLPLLEAHKNGLKIIAAERDYVRDVVVPDFTFDPDSACSIARAIMRHMGKEPKITPPDDAETFIKKLLVIN